MIYDAIIVGAGPGGGQCARELAQKGWKVLLIEKAKSFLTNNFSSGGAPIELMKEFDLPYSLAGTFWNRLTVISTRETTSWDSRTPLGPIFDFDKLRAFLCHEMVKSGGDFFFHSQYVSHEIKSPYVEVKIKNLDTQEEKIYTTKVLVDATGTERKVLMGGPDETKKAMVATGIEHHIQVSEEVYSHFSQAMTFYLGHKWMPQGYGWVFAMKPNQLKVGVVRYFQNESHVPHIASYKPYLDQLLSLCGPQESRKTIDKHGKTIHYTLGQKDCYSKGPVIAIGDALSSINPLGCEGIRHAMVSGRLAAKEISSFLEGKVTSFRGYDRALKKYFGMKWFCSELMMNHLYKNKRDDLLDRTVRCFRYMNTRQMLDLIFNYRYRAGFKSFVHYFLG